MRWKGPMPVINQDQIKAIEEYLAPKADNGELDRLNKRVSELLRDNAALRKKLSTGYHFTKEDLKAHDAIVAKKAREAAKRDILINMHKEMDAEYERQKARFDEETQAFWDECKREFKGDDENESFFAWCRVMWSIPIKVLVDCFHWKAITEDCCCDNRQALVKFCNKCIEMADDLRKNQTKDIRTLCKEIADETGASFVISEEEE